ncbi:hypothetical protein [Aromatoleum anaerobium]|uniref:hypothetical protein n=1 Tax=Aromatoleum anaerobium TaxID=182180 RepID=UPI001FF32757|nr:hypothetical protein [Aromatoleum anaerobium]MCK0506548.1 hypothetical protein [Aromatoleum anaerobium]
MTDFDITQAVACRARTASRCCATPSGYKVVFVPFSGGAPSGEPIDVLTGFVNGDGEAQGRPVGVAIDNRGALLVADDVGNVIWRVSAMGDAAGAGTAGSGR